MSDFPTNFLCWSNTNPFRLQKKGTMEKEEKSFIRKKISLLLNKLYSILPIYNTETVRLIEDQNKNTGHFLLIFVFGVISFLVTKTLLLFTGVSSFLLTKYRNRLKWKCVQVFLCSYASSFDLLSYKHTHKQTSCCILLTKQNENSFCPLKSRA